jgi:hypothetical protein
MSIITKQHAQRLIRAGKADEIGVKRDDHYVYIIVQRKDMQRIDHVRHCRYGTHWHLPPLTKLGRRAQGEAV